MRKDPHSKYYVAAGAVLLVVGVFGWYQGWFSPKIKYSDKNTPNKVLEDQNPIFRQAQAASRLGDYQTALTGYKEALDQARDLPQKNQIQYKIAAMTDLSGNARDAAVAYKKIALDTSAVASMRAYAVLMLGRMYVLNPKDEIFSIVFEGEPFHSMSMGVDKEEALKNLFEFSASFSPLAMSELYSARWYAKQLYLEHERKITLTDEQKMEYLRIVRQRLAAGKADATRMASDPNENVHVPPAAALGAQILSYLYFIGEEKEQRIHDAYANAFSLSTVYNRPGDEGLARMRYALFMTEIGGAANIQKAEDTLAPMYSDMYAKSIPTIYLKNLTSAAPEYNDVVTLAQRMPSFKTFLVSLGWDSAQL